MARPTEKPPFQSLEILSRKISISRIKTLKGQWETKRQSVTVRPATFASLTIGQLFHILNQVQLYPYKETHSFVFGEKLKFQVKVYVDEDPEDETEINPDES